MKTKVSETTFFKLRSAREYRFYNRAGQRMLNLLAAQVLRVTDPEDIEYFRSRLDVVTECLEDGTPLNEVGKIGHYIDGKAKSFRVFGRGRNDASIPGAPRKAAPTPKSVAVGSPQPVAAVSPVVTPVVSPRPSSTTPGQTLSGIPTRVSEIVSPIEEASGDGSTRAVRPSLNPLR